MVDKKITLSLMARNALAKGLAGAKASLAKFGKAAARVGKMIAVGFVAAGAAVVAFGVKSLKAYGAQIEAETALTAALKARGEAGRKLLPMLKKQAAAIQDETGAADEQTLATMAQLSLLGVHTSELKEAAKATVALKSVGLEGASAQRAVALAMQGNFEMLNRYVPAIRNATTEQEKATAANELFRQGYEQQKALLDTLPGQWKNLQGRIGDALEKIGEAITGGTGMVDVLKRMADWVKNLTDDGRLEEWAVKATEAMLKAKDAILAIGKAIAWAGDRIHQSVDFLALVASGESPQDAARITLERKELRELKKEIDAFNRWVKREDEKSEADRKNRVSLSGNTRSGRGGPEIPFDLQALEASRIQKEVDARKAKAKEIWLKMDKLFAKKEEAQQRDKNEALRKAAAERIKDAEKEVARLTKLSKMRVKDFIADAKAEKDKNKELADEAAMMKKIIEKSKKRGLKLGRRDQERLDAFNKIQAAGNGLGAAQALLDKEKKALKEIQGGQLLNLQQINAEIKVQNKKLNDLLAMG